MRPGNPEALSQPYDPRRIEPERYAFCERLGVFQPRADLAAQPKGTGSKAPFVIAIPPPNVTGSLTMGHVLGESVRDCVIRWQRMEGRETLYIPGMDHAGIATQNVVEKKLRSEKRSRAQSGVMPSRRSCWKMMPPYCSFHSHTALRKPSRPSACRERFSERSFFSTTFWVAMPAWSMPGM